MIYNGWDDSRFNDMSLKDDIAFSKNKVAKLYKLHIITMLLTLPMEIAIVLYNGVTKRLLGTLILKIFFNITLLQSWYPDIKINTSLNGVAWYLSTSIFLYMIFPLIRYILKKMDQRSTNYVINLVFVFIAVLFAQLSVSIIALRSGLSNDTYTWLTYCFPLYRLGDFVVGASLGYAYLMKRVKDNNIELSNSRDSIVRNLGYTVWEIGIIVFVIGYNKFVKTKLIGEFGQAYRNWTTQYIIVAGILVYIYALNEGYITKILNCKWLKKIGGLSAEAYLIHYVITNHVAVGIDFLGMQIGVEKRVVIICVEFALTIVLSLAYRQLKYKKFEILRIKKDE